MDESIKNRTGSEVSDAFWKLCSGGVNIKLLDSIMALDLPGLIGIQGAKTQEEIIAALGLSPERGKKWLYLLTDQGFLIEKSLKNNRFAYSLAPSLQAMASNADIWAFFKNIIYMWRTLEVTDIATVLRGGDVPYVLHWPPLSALESQQTETLMRQSAKPVVEVLCKNFPFKDIKTLLDVGGGDASVVCGLLHHYPHLKCTVYNIPEGIKQAKIKIESEKLTDKIELQAGNFIDEMAFKGRYDTVLFSRVLCDWPMDICMKLLTMAYNALSEGGQLIICEPFKDNNENLALMWEFFYLHWDDFGRHVFKGSAEYVSVLEEIGFVHCKLSVDKNTNRLLTATKMNKDTWAF